MRQGSVRVFRRLTDGVWRGVDTVTSTVSDTVSEAFFEPVIRLGVTGLARSGKTVFITALIANLLERGRMGQMRGVADGAIRAVYLHPQPDDTLPRFAFEDHLAALTGDAPQWPDNTRGISTLRLSFRVQSGGLRGLTGARRVHVDIVDYPGEWLLDLALLNMDYAEWSAQVLARAADRPGGAAYLTQAHTAQADVPFTEGDARALAEGYTAHLAATRAAGFSDCTPGRFLMPGDMAGSPVLTFAPLPPGKAPRGSLAREMARRFDAYKARIVRPFFRDHFTRIDRQVVLVDALDAIHAGPRAVEDQRRAMAGLLTAFRPGRNAWLSTLLRGRRVDRILFAATKADHLHHTQHSRLTAIVEAMLRDARARADFSGAITQAMSIAAVRATVEEVVQHQGTALHCVRGTLLDTGRQAAFYPGELPDDPMRLLSPAREGAGAWLDADYQIMRFAPALADLTPGDGLPHIRLDRAAEFLLGDKLI